MTEDDSFKTAKSYSKFYTHEPLITVQPRARRLQYSDAQTYEGLKSTEKRLDLARLKAVGNQNFLNCPSALVFPSDEPTLDDSRMVWSPVRHTHPGTNL